MTNRKIIAVSIEPYFLDKLDAEAKRLGVTRSRLITLLAIEAIPLRDWASPHSKHEPLITKDSLNEAYGYRASVAPAPRCKDCKWWNTEWKHEAGDCYCYKVDQWTDPSFFCAWGEWCAGGKTDDGN